MILREYTRVYYSGLSWTDDVILREYTRVYYSGLSWKDDVILREYIGFATPACPGKMM